MSEYHQRPNYVMILVWLAVFTGLELIAAEVIAEPTSKLIILVGLAITKAALVALYFMHLKYEKSTLMVIAFTPMLICAFLVFMLMPDLGAVVHKSSLPPVEKTKDH